MTIWTQTQTYVGDEGQGNGGEDKEVGEQHYPLRFRLFFFFFHGKTLHLQICQQQQRQYLYLCTNKASKVSTPDVGGGSSSRGGLR